MKRLFRLAFGEWGIRRDVASEISFHMDMKERELIAAGVPPAQAREQARAAFGDVESIEAQCREERRRTVRARAWREALGSVMQDVRYAGRTLARSPGFTAAALVTLALGIGANSAIFSMVDGAVLRRPPYGEADRLVVVQHPSQAVGAADIGFSAPAMADFERNVHTLDAVAEYHSMSFDLLGHGEPRRVQVGVVSADYFGLLGVKPLLGRAFIAGEDQPGAQPVLLLSYRFWQDQLGGDSSIVGQSFTMNDRRHVVIGVLPPLPRFPNANDLYMPISSCPFRSSPGMATDRGMRMVSMIGRLAPGATRPQARLELGTLETRLHASYAQAYRGVEDATIATLPIRDVLDQSAKPAFLLLLGIAGLVLLVACANVAHLTLARQLRRGRELAIRTALGAGRRRLFRQLLTESLLLSLGGGALGLALAALGMGTLRQVSASFTPRAQEIGLDWRVVVFTVLVALVTGLAFGCGPALAGRADLAGALRERGASTAGGRRGRLRGTLVITEVALAFVVLISAGLMLRDLRHLLTTDLGYQPQHVVTARVDLNWSRYPDKPSRWRLEQALLERLGQVPGVTGIALANQFPASSSSPRNRNSFVIRGGEAADPARQPKAEFNIVSPGYFRTIGATLLRGRDFTPADRDSAGAVALLSHSAVQRYFGTADPLGREISIDGKRWMTIVGVVGDVRQFGPAADVPEQVYLPAAAYPMGDFRVLIRSGGPSTQAEALLRRTVEQLDPEQPVTEVRTLEQARNDVIASSRLTAMLLAIFAVVALTVAAAGLGGVMAYSVGQRKQEFGIRLALGARRGAILGLVLGEGVRLVAIGLVLGAVASRLVSHLIGGLLYGVPSTDLATYVGVAVLFLGVAILTCLEPARRATAVDPARALQAS